MSDQALVLTSCAPVLFVPDLLSAAECEELIGRYAPLPHQRLQYYHLERGMFSVEEEPDAARGLEVNVEDPALQSRVDALYRERLAPAVEDIFPPLLRGGRVHVIRLLTYDGATRDFLAPHRDRYDHMPIPCDMCDRVLAISIPLSEGYGGGEFRFPEYGPTLYRPTMGCALIFPVQLLHEIVPVTSGVRHSLTFFVSHRRTSKDMGIDLSKIVEAVRGVGLQAMRQAASELAHDPASARSVLTSAIAEAESMIAEALR